MYLSSAQSQRLQSLVQVHSLRAQAEHPVGDREVELNDCIGDLHLAMQPPRWGMQKAGIYKAQLCNAEVGTVGRSLHPKGHADL